MKRTILIFKKISLFIFSFLLVFGATSCSNTADNNTSTANYNFSRDGSGSFTLRIDKEYIDPDTSETKTRTVDDINATVNFVTSMSDKVSGMEDRVTLKNIKEEDDQYVVDLKFMRIQYLSLGGNGGDLGVYNYINGTDFVQEDDSVSDIIDYWSLGSYKSVIKFQTNEKYNFANYAHGDNDSVILPTIKSTNEKLTYDETVEYFSDHGELAKNKRGKLFSFFIADIEGLESITYNFQGKIKSYAANNVESVTDSSITIRPTSQAVSIISPDMEAPLVKNVNCFVGYVYFDLAPNWALIGVISFIAIGLITGIVVLIKKGVFTKIANSRTFTEIKKNYSLYLMLIPSMVLIFLFSYLPMGGVSLAFKNYNINDGIWNSEWASMGGFRHFYSLFTNTVSQFPRLLLNTFILAFWKFLFGFVLALALAVLFSYLRNKFFKKTVQSISYLPYFVSWVIISAIANSILAQDGGLINKFLELIGQQPINFYAEPKYWRFILTFTAMWKTTGYSTIIYLAAINSINASLYEAVQLDGGGRWRQFLHVTLPGLTPVLGVQIVFSLGNLVRDDFDQIVTMTRGSALLRDTTETIGTLTYSLIGKPSNYSDLAAMGLLQGLIALAIIIISNRILKAKGIDGAY